VKAAVLSERGGAFQVADLAIDDPRAGEVRIALRASGVCHSDLSVARGTLGEGHPMPCVLGHEGAGIVVQLGPGVGGVRVGDHVVFAWVSPCRACRTCLAGQPNLCLAPVGARKNYLRDAETTIHAIRGAFAEEMIVPAAAAIKIDDDLPLDVAALVGCGVSTGVGAVINTARLVPGSSVVVFGCGGVGLNVIQGARLAGAAEIVAVDPLESKLDIAKKFGATHFVRPTDLADLVQDLTKGVGFDYAFEVVGRPETIRAAWDASRRGGDVIIVGAGSADAQVNFSPGEIFRMERKLVGSCYGSADPVRDFPRLLNLWRLGKLDIESLISRRITLDEVDAAVAMLDRGEVIRSVIEFA
jgi:S-(hydroxymethyl)glutathione dehydrogenase / alcohol dehydrogenase